MTYFNDALQKFLIKQTGKAFPMSEAWFNFLRANNGTGPIHEAELTWLRAKIATLGGTPTGKRADLWKQLNAVSSLTVHNSISANQKGYFIANS